MSAEAAVVETIPSHVPPELVWNRNFDTFTSEGDDPWLAVSRMHDLPPIVWSPQASYGRPGWIATRHDVIAEAMIDYERFSAERAGMIADLVGEPVRLNPIEIDPPAHHGYRKILNPYFTPKAIRGLEDAVRQACVELIAKFESLGECDFIEEFAVPFPSYVFLDLMGMPRDMVGQFIAWEEGIMRAPDPMDRVKAARAVYEYLKQHKDKQRENPSNEFLAGMVNGEVDGRPLNHLELMGMFYVLYVGGLDTVYSTLGWIMRHLVTHPELQTRLRENPGDIPAAVEEFSRAFSVVVTHREVAKDCTFHGVELKKGEEFNLPLALADRDPSVFPDPHTIDIDRRPRHIAFGTGTHNCIGIHLAKRELRIVIEEFLARFGNIRLRDGEAYRFHTGRTFGIDYLPLTLAAR
jgi:cytochrome P450